MTSTEGVRTRSGRISKPPERYSPIEDVIDDYTEDEYDEDDDEESYEEEETDSDEEEDETEEEDEKGNLKDFIVYEEEEA